MLQTNNKVSSSVLLKWIKKSFFVFAIFVSISSKAQYDTIYVNGVPKITKKKVAMESVSPLKKDDYLLSASYGVPFSPLWEASFFGLDYLGTGINSSKSTSNLNHICLNADYQVSDDISVGLEFTYAAINIQYTKRYGIGTSGGSTSGYVDSSFSARFSKTRFLVKMGYHFNISERFDLYTTAGFGFKQFNYVSKDYNLSSTDYLSRILPLAVRASVGGRFFFNPDLALQVEGGIGGPLMQIGLCYKMHSASNWK